MYFGYFTPHKVMLKLSPGGSHVLSDGKKHDFRNNKSEIGIPLQNLLILKLNIKIGNKILNMISGN